MSGPLPAVGVVVPAHDEGPVIERLLHHLLEGCPAGAADVVVVANGCTDDTAERARAVAGRVAPRLSVVELEAASKTAAISAGLARTTGDVVAVVDADVVLDWPTLAALADELRAAPGPRVGAPSISVDTTGCPWLVRSYFRVWTELPYVRSDMVGSGVFALNAAAVERIGTLPDVLNDDAWVRRSFGRNEKIVGPGSFTVFAPRSVGALVRRRTRVDLGNRELASHEVAAPRGGNGLRDVVAAARRGEHRRRDVLGFVTLSLAARCLGAWRRRRGSGSDWSQDRTTRGPGPA